MRDVNISLGLYSPFKFNKDTYLGYDIKKFRDNIRFLSVLINRDGQMGGVCPLFFDGAVCDFKELPLPDNQEALSKIYNYLNKIRGKSTVKVFHIYTQKINENTNDESNFISKFVTLFKNKK